MNIEKKKAAEKLIASFLKKHKLQDKKNVKIGFLSEDESIGKIGKLPSGIIPFDIITGGGYVKGHVNVVTGGESVGKTTLFLNSIAYSQENCQPWLDAYLNNEKSFDRTWAAKNGIKTEHNILIGEFETAEESTDFCNDCTEPNSGVDRLFIDTLQALSSEGELRKGKDIKSVGDNTMALLPRVFSQFLRMYTSLSLGQLTLVLGSQIRVDLGSYGAPTTGTGGNAIKHYNLLSVDMARAGKAEWPVPDIPPNSYPVRFRLQKAKVSNRYKGCTLIGYFYKGSFERKFNIIAIGKDLKLHDNKLVEYEVSIIDPETNETRIEKREFKARGFNDLYNKIPDEAVDWLETKLMDAYTNSVMADQPNEEEGAE